MHCKVVYLSCLLLYNLDFILLWNAVFHATYFTCCFVNSVIVIWASVTVFCPSISWKLWYIVSWNSVSVYGAIWPSLRPYTVINPISLTYWDMYIHLDKTVQLVVAKCVQYGSLGKSFERVIVPEEFWHVQIGWAQDHTDTTVQIRGLWWIW